MKHLPQHVLEQITAHFDLRLNDEAIAPGVEGKKAFFQGAVVSKTFLPLGLQVAIDITREETPQRDYLFQQPRFADRYFRYQD